MYVYIVLHTLSPDFMSYNTTYESRLHQSIYEYIYTQT